MEFQVLFCAIFLVFLTLWTVTVQVLLSDIQNESRAIRHFYSSAILKGLRPTTTTTINSTVYKSIPREIRPHRRGKRAGVRTRLQRRPFRPFLPTVITGNARSLNNKMDILTANMKFIRDYREASMVCFSETWFHDLVSSDSVNIDGFKLARGDRSADSNKECGGGVCVYVNKQWCSENNVHIVKDLCTPDIEFLSVVVRPYYLPREFPKITMNVIYVPPHANVKLATDTLVDLVHEQQSACPDGVIYLTGDFNQCVPSSSIPSFKQYVDQPTRNNNTLDLTLWQYKQCLQMCLFTTCRII